MPLIVSLGLGSSGAGAASFDANTLTPAATYLDVTFTSNVGPLAGAAALTDYWTFSTAGDYPIEATSLTVIGDVVRIGITEAKSGDVYTLTLPPAGLSSLTGVVFNGDFTRSFTAVATAPVVATAVSVDTRHTRIIFSEAVDEDLALDPSNYVFDDPSVVAVAVAKETDNTYLLTTTAQNPGSTYQVTVSGITDDSGNPI